MSSMENPEGFADFSSAATLASTAALTCLAMVPLSVSSTFPLADFDFAPAFLRGEAPLGALEARFAFAEGVDASFFFAEAFGAGFAFFAEVFGAGFAFFVEVLFFIAVGWLINSSIGNFINKGTSSKYFGASRRNLAP